MSYDTCLVCGETFAAKPSAKQRYCSHPCYARSRTKGRRGGATYHAWKSMRSRCSTDLDYAGRGITVCERWNSFETFLADMGERPSADHSLDRKDNDGNYEPSNCRWATRSEQQLNRRVNHVLTYQGKTQPLVVWARELSIPVSTLVERIRRYGWTVEQALSRTTPLKGVRP